MVNMRYRVVQIVTPRFKEEDDVTYRVEYFSNEDNAWRCYTEIAPITGRVIVNRTKDDAYNLFQKLCFEADPKNQPRTVIVNMYPSDSETE